jgi:hypothetical protein
MGSRSNVLFTYSRVAVVLFVCMWGGTMLVSRSYMMYKALNAEWTRKSNNAWLLEKCNDPEFYFNLKEHTDLCADVVSNHQSSVWLNALYIVVVSTHLCGVSSCLDVVESVLSAMGWPLLLFCVLCAFVSPNIAYLIYRRLTLSSLEKMETICINDGKYRRQYPPLENYPSVPCIDLCSSESQLRHRNFTEFTG